MTDTHRLLERQAEWQKGRAALTWAEKIRMAEAVREDVAKLRRARMLPIAAVSESKGPEIGESQVQQGE